MTQSDPGRRKALADVTQGENFGRTRFLASLGGVQGIVESIVPGLLFVIVQTVTQRLVLAAVVSLGSLAILVLIRIVRRGPLSGVFGGVIVLAIGIGFALFSGRATNNYLPGLISNAVLTLLFFVSLAARYPWVGLVVGTILGDPVGWRTDPRKYRAFFWSTWIWIACSLIRLAIMVPLYLASLSSGSIVALGIAKLATGLPVFALEVFATWLLVRPAYAASEEPPEAQDA